MRSRDTYSSTNLYQEWEERLMTPVRSSTNFTSHTPKVGEMGREWVEAMHCDLHCPNFNGSSCALDYTTANNYYTSYANNNSWDEGQFSSTFLLLEYMAIWSEKWASQNGQNLVGPSYQILDSNVTALVTCYDISMYCSVLNFQCCFKFWGCGVLERNGALMSHCN